jgi:hypothetical protein
MTVRTLIVVDYLVGFVLIILAIVTCRESDVFDPSVRQRITFEGDWLSYGRLCHTFPTVCMSANKSSLGDCPNCGEPIPTAWLLVEYEKDSGETGIWAACPESEKSSRRSSYQQNQVFFLAYTRQDTADGNS